MLCSLVEAHPPPTHSSPRPLPSARVPHLIAPLSPPPYILSYKGCNLTTTSSMKPSTPAPSALSHPMGSRPLHSALRECQPDVPSYVSQRWLPSFPHFVEPGGRCRRSGVPNSRKGAARREGRSEKEGESFLETNSFVQLFCSFWWPKTPRFRVGLFEGAHHSFACLPPPISPCDCIDGLPHHSFWAGNYDMCVALCAIHDVHKVGIASRGLPAAVWSISPLVWS